jgi:hypothetical protein
MLEEKALKKKAYAQSKAKKPCHRSGEKGQNPKAKTPGIIRHSEEDASGLRTCIG